MQVTRKFQRGEHFAPWSGGRAQQLAARAVNSIIEPICARYLRAGTISSLIKPDVRRAGNKVARVNTHGESEPAAGQRFLPLLHAALSLRLPFLRPPLYQAIRSATST